MLFNGFETQLRGGMPARAARHPRIDLEAQAAGRDRLALAPRGNQIESLADGKRRPSVARDLRPIDQILLANLRPKLGESLELATGRRRVFEERAYAARFFRDARSVPQLGQSRPYERYIFLRSGVRMAEQAARTTFSSTPALGLGPGRSVAALNEPRRRLQAACVRFSLFHRDVDRLLQK